MEIHNLDNPAFCEAMGLSNVFKAYAEECSREDIMEVGFNANSGYVYIALENGITIASCMGQRVEYIVTDFESGEESFFDNYTLALNH
jgi:hypothetical protein